LYGLYFLAVVHAVSGNHAEATSVFREGVALARDHPEALNYWASWCVDAGGDALFPLVADDALGAAVRACELSSHKAPHILDTRARVHFERGELDDAIRWQQEALKYAADDKRAAIAEVLATYQAARDEQPTAASDTTP
jgi:tetratricopeptide (TPR) repeat protein